MFLATRSWTYFGKAKEIAMHKRLELLSKIVLFLLILYQNLLLERQNRIISKYREESENLRQQFQLLKNEYDKLSIIQIYKLPHPKVENIPSYNMRTMPNDKDSKETIQ